MGKKFKMPTAKEFLDKKRIYDEKQDPIWVTLEREMKENADKGIKPYNDKVDVWLRFLKDINLYRHCTGKQNEKSLKQEAGPPWYTELSSTQRQVLANLKADIHQDILEDLPNRVTRALNDLGLTLKFSRTTLMHAMSLSVEDPGVFIWNLYKATYNQPPSEMRKSYDMNAMIMMSSLVFVDLQECIDTLESIVTVSKPPAPPKPKKTAKTAQPSSPLGEYLKESKPVPMHSNHGDGEETKAEPPKLDYKLRLRTEESLTKLVEDQGFLGLRMERNEKEAQIARECNYKFWEPPSTLRNTDPKLAAYVEQLRVMKLKPKPKYEAPYKNVQYQVAGMTYIKGRPQIILANVATLQTGYIPINGGIAYAMGNPVTTINGYWKYPKTVRDKCQPNCDCMTKWGGSVLRYIDESKCKCGHLYDQYVQEPCRQPGTSKDKSSQSPKHGTGREKAKVQSQVGICNEKYFYPPTKHGPFWIDKAKVFQMDPVEDLIKDVVQENVQSSKGASEKPPASLSASEVKVEELLGAFLADLSDTPLLIPHLPGANLLNNLQEWVRSRVKGPREPKGHKQLLLKTQRNWVNLKHMDFRERAFRIPFTQTELKNMKWSHRTMIQDLFNNLLHDFVTRNQAKQLEQTRLFWATMHADSYPSKSFIDVFYTYMPGRMKDTYLLNPYSSILTPKFGAKTCPLRF